MCGMVRVLAEKPVQGYLKILTETSFKNEPITFKASTGFEFQRIIKNEEKNHPKKIISRWQFPWKTKQTWSFICQPLQKKTFLKLQFSYSTIFSFVFLQDDDVPLFTFAILLLFRYGFLIFVFSSSSNVIYGFNLIVFFLTSPSHFLLTVLYLWNGKMVIYSAGKEEHIAMVDEKKISN